MEALIQHTMRTKIAGVDGGLHPPGQDPPAGRLRRAGRGDAGGRRCVRRTNERTPMPRQSNIVQVNPNTHVYTIDDGNSPGGQGPSLHVGGPHRQDARLPPPRPPGCVHGPARGGREALQVPPHGYPLLGRGLQPGPVPHLAVRCFGGIVFGLGLGFVLVWAYSAINQHDPNPTTATRSST